ncbi:SdrD B-like domain-containing protein [Rhodopirellula sallentina]|uniref:Cna B domain-containing protein n=1 Tax=Rhodopirellula sallentina SM41 TaxID=1263870 RepID=M5U5A7_9BACT|nr:SdrD B-like domain-containing protein [Rhodopirellula sallentina]EMI56625.1 Cna B domain-containing protein [Rhodopirellula sallentina SM41]
MPPLTQRSFYHRGRRLLLESLEDRRVLATLGVDIGFYSGTQFPDPEDDPPVEISGPVLRGETVYVAFQVQDIRDEPIDDPVGVIALPLDLDWNGETLRFEGDANLDASGNPQLPSDDRLVTPSFPLQRAVGSLNVPPGDGEFDVNNPEFELQDVRGGALPALGQGQAIGVAAPEVFSELPFVAVANADETFLTAGLSGAMSFADAAVLDGVAGIDQTEVISDALNIVQVGLQIVGGSIGGVKFDDLNGNGTRDAGEPGVEGVTIELTRTDEAMTIAPVTTDANGNYLFDDLPKGVYSVNEIPPTGTQQTTPADSLANLTLNQDNQNIADVDIGNFTLVTLSGSKFNDADGDSVRDDSETGVEGVTINLDLDSDGSVDRTTTTDAAGNYGFADVGPGQHTIREVLPPGFVQTLPVNDNGYVQSVTSGADIEGLDFGNREVTTTVSGFKFDDVNGDGLRQAGEPGVEGITVQLDVDSDGSDVRSVQTAADGSFVFENVPAGMHRVAEMLPVDAVQTAPGGNGVIEVDVDPPATVEDLLFGNFTLTTLSGVVFEDVNGNDIQDAGEPGIETTVELDLDSDGSVDLTAMTDADGRYEFDNVGPGTHRITEVVPTGFLNPPTPAEYSIANQSGVDRADLDFANRQLDSVEGSIQGFVYTDNDFDGVFDPVEFGLPGVTVRLESADGGVARTATTAADGSYVFLNVPAGNYRMIEEQPSGFGDASITPGRVLPLGETIGTPDGLNAFSGVTLGENQTAIDYNFGEVLTAVTKRMFVASANVRGELASNAGTPALTIDGTRGDDQIIIENLGEQGFQIFVNDEPGVIVSPEQASLVLIDGLGGQDRVEYRGSVDAEQIRTRPGEFSVTTPRQSIGVFDVDDIRIQGGGGDDHAIIRDSAGSDTLNAAANAVLVSLSSDQSIGVVDVPVVQAVSDVDEAEDTATIEAIDFVLQLAGDWN